MRKFIYHILLALVMLSCQSGGKPNKEDEVILSPGDCEWHDRGKAQEYLDGTYIFTHLVITTDSSMTVYPDGIIGEDSSSVVPPVSVTLDRDQFQMSYCGVPISMSGHVKVVNGALFWQVCQILDHGIGEWERVILNFIQKRNKIDTTGVTVQLSRNDSIDHLVPISHFVLDDYLMNSRHSEYSLRSCH